MRMCRVRAVQPDAGRRATRGSLLEMLRTLARPPATLLEQILAATSGRRNYQRWPGGFGGMSTRDLPAQCMAVAGMARGCGAPGFAPGAGASYGNVVPFACALPLRCGEARWARSYSSHALP